MKRKSGVLMPIFSLPSQYGIGDFGTQAYNFIDYLKSANQTIWQILPLAPTAYGNSPYSSTSAQSFNPYFISLELLVKEGLLTQKEADLSLYNGKYIDYDFINSVRLFLLKKAFSRFEVNNAKFQKFVESKQALDYALYTEIKRTFNGKPFYNWSDDYKFCKQKTLETFYKNHYKEVLFWEFVQFKAKEQWINIKTYANKNGIEIIGDMPLYVALDSVDVWKNPKLFNLDQDFCPITVAGVPPDYFCEEGQLWGNPVYDYNYHSKTNFSWWINRIKSTLEVVDYVRIDHFRGLDRFYQVPYGATNAKEGEWVEVPSKQLFNAIHSQIDKNKIIAEDLGIIDDGVRQLLATTGYPGMKILSFAFNGQKDNFYLPENIEENSICYTGTHDNDTLLGLIENSTEWDYNNLLNGVKESLKLANIEKEIKSKQQLIDAIIELGFYSKAKMFILPMQDILYMNSEMRINVPGAVNLQNWAVKFSEKDFSNQAKEKLKNLTIKYNR